MFTVRLVGCVLVCFLAWLVGWLVGWSEFSLVNRMSTYPDVQAHDAAHVYNVQASLNPTHYSSPVANPIPPE